MNGSPFKKKQTKKQKKKQKLENNGVERGDVDMIGSTGYPEFIAMESGYDGSASGTDCGTGPHVFKPPRFKYGYPTRK